MAISFNRRQHIKFSPKAVPGLLEAWYAPYLGGFNVGPLGTVSTLPDLSGRGRFLTNATELFSPYLGSGLGGNLARQSDDFTTATYPNTVSTIWVPTSVTINSSSTFTFTAANGNLSQAIRYTPNKVYTVTFNAQKITGHTALKLLATNSVEGDQTLTLTTTLDPYTFTVTAPNTFTLGAISVGIKDSNASGFGQVKVTNFQVRESGWAAGYVATANQIIRPAYNGLPVLAFGQGFSGAAGHLFSSAFTLNQPWTVYMLVRPLFGSNVQTYYLDGLHSGGNTTGAVINTGNTSLLANIQAGGGGVNATGGSFGTWNVITGVFNGANSLCQINRGVPATQDVGASNPGGLSFGTRADENAGRSMNYELLECIIRNGADNAETQNAFQLYLADVAGIVI